MTRRADILALGEPMVEFVHEDHPDLGPIYRQGFGGDTSNAIIAAARQGVRAGYLTALGQDDFGDALIKLWQGEGVITDHVIRVDNAPTAAYFVRPHPSGRSFSYLRKGSAASLYAPADLPEDAIGGARVLHTSAISQAISPDMRGAVTRAMSLARNAGTLTSYDTNLRLNLWSLDMARETVFSALAQADIIFPSDDEARLLTGLEDMDAMLDRFLAFGAQVVAMKCGEAGAIIATSDGRHKIPPSPCNPVDATGAGDSYAGAFLAYLLEFDDPVKAGHLAARVAAGTVAGFGAIGPIPHRDQIIG